MSVPALLDVPRQAAVRRRRPRLPWEALSVVLGAALVTCWTNQGTLTGLTTTVAGDLGDPLYFAWQLAWVRHALLTDPGGLWTTPAFLQAPDNLAFTDTVLGYAPLGLVVPDGQAGALAMLNLATLIAGAVAVIGGYALARAMGAGWLGALVAGAGFGFAPWRLEQVIHINVISTGGIALALAFLARGNGWSLARGWEPHRMSPRWIAAGWLVACWQLTCGFATGIWFVYSLAVPMAAWAAGWGWQAWRRGDARVPLPRRVVVAHGAGGLAFLLTLGLLLRPYLRVMAAHPQVKRGENWLPLFSPSWKGLLTAPATDWFWGQRQVRWRAGLSWPPEMILSPGIVLLVLALAGVLFSVFPWRRRLGLAAATAALAVLAMGTAFPLGHGEWTYLPLFRHLPGWSALRTPGRLMIFVTLGLGLLAAGAVARFHRELWPGPGPFDGVAPRPGPLRRAAARDPWWVVAAVTTVLLAVLPAGVVLGEGANTTRHWPVATSPVALAALRQPVLLLPTDLVGDYHMMLWGTEGWPVLANGNSGFDPPAQAALRAEARTFPDARSVAALRARGILTVVVIRSRAWAGPWADAAERRVDGLGISRTDLGDAVVFSLLPSGRGPVRGGR